MLWRALKSKGFRTFFGASIFVGVLAAYIGYPRLADSAAPLAKDIVFNVEPLRPQDITLTTSYVGYVTPIKSVDLVPNVSGYISDVLVTGGQDVKVGDNLVLIDQREYKAALDAAAAAVSKAKADFSNADVYYKRIKRAGAKAVSQTEIDNAKAAYLSAAAALEQAKAELEKAKVMYDYTLLQASIDGVVGNVSLTDGNYVAPAGTPLLSIIQYDPIRVVFAVSDKEYMDAAARRNGAPLFNDEKIKLKLSNGKIYQTQGEFKYTDNAIDKSTGTVAVYADFANPDHELIANAYVDVLIERVIKDSYAVRQNYVQLTTDGAYIYTAQNNQLRKTPVHIIGEQNGTYILADKFAQDEYLVIDRVGTIPAGSNVKIKVAAEKN